MHPTELFGARISIIKADDGPAVQKVLDGDEQQAHQNKDRGDFLVESEEKSFNL